MTVKPEEGQLILDFRESDAQVDFINCPQGQTRAAIVTAVAWSLPPQTPRNQGLMNCLTILTKEGSVLDPIYPATSGAQAPTLGTHVTECVQVALGQVVPKDTSALWARHLNPIITGRRRDLVDPANQIPPALLDGPLSRGWFDGGHLWLRRLGWTLLGSRSGRVSEGADRTGGMGDSVSMVASRVHHGLSR